MEQLSMFADDIRFPITHEDVMALFQKYIYENEKDPDVLTFSDIKGGKSYSFYGEKVFEHFPGTIDTVRVGIAYLDQEGNKKFKKQKAAGFTAEQIRSFMEQMKTWKHQIFRSLIVENFACCASFKECSDAKHCLFEDDRFYNGCYYRKNLESGKIFYGKNKNA